MRVLFDANVVIDLLTNRAEFAQQAREAFTICYEKDFLATISAAEMTTLYYVLRKYVGKDSALRHMRSLFDTLTIIDVTSTDIDKALNDNMPDFEDAVIAYSAKRAKTDYIITRNLKDFVNSPVPALSPKDFVKKFKK